MLELLRLGRASGLAVVAPELWRQFHHRPVPATGPTPRPIPNATREVVRVQFAKVAEYQRRGVVHLHALIRLDGPSTDLDLYPAPVWTWTPSKCAIKVRPTCPQTRTAEAPPAADTCDSRPAAPRLPVWRAVSSWTRAGRRRVDMLGFRGHLATRSRRYSTTLGPLRQARRTRSPLPGRANQLDRAVSMPRPDNRRNNRVGYTRPRLTSAGLSLAARGPARSERGHEPAASGSKGLTAFVIMSVNGR